MAALRAPGGRMQGAAAQAMSVHIVPPPQPEGRMGLAGDRGVAPPRRSTPGSPSSSRLALASQYPCARPFVLSPRAARLPRIFGARKTVMIVSRFFQLAAFVMLSTRALHPPAP